MTAVDGALTGYLESECAVEFLLPLSACYLAPHLYLAGRSHGLYKARLKAVKASQQPAFQQSPTRSKQACKELEDSSTMPAAADSDNESVLSSLPSSPPADEQEDRDSLSEGEGEEQEQEQEHDMQRDESDAETEPLPPTSSARHGRTAAGPSSKRRHILQTESSSSDEHENAGDAARGRGEKHVLRSEIGLYTDHTSK